MPLPQDIANLLAVAIRDVIWYKDRVYDFLKSNGVPAVTLKEVRKLQKEGEPTIKTGHYVLSELEKFGDAGRVTTKRLLTSMNYWKDLQSVEAERRPKAEKSLAALKQACEAGVPGLKCASG